MNKCGNEKKTIQFPIQMQKIYNNKNINSIIKRLQKKH